MAAEIGSHDPGPQAKPKFAMVLDAQAQAVLAARCARLEQQFRSAPTVDLTAMASNPRVLHSALYTDLSPTLPQAAGTYRGTRGTDLENAQRVVLTRGAAEGLKRTDHCAAPDRVIAAMDAFQDDIRTFWASSDHTDPLTVLSRLTHQFFWIHPFIDGNGHVWRLALIAMARHAGLHPSREWQVAARPYGPTFSVALQKFETSPSLLAQELSAFFKAP